MMALGDLGVPLRCDRPSSPDGTGRIARAQVALTLTGRARTPVGLTVAGCSAGPASSANGPWAVTFPRTTLRYLRLSPAGPLRDPWTIVEVECLQ